MNKWSILLKCSFLKVTTYPSIILKGKKIARYHHVTGVYLCEVWIGYNWVYEIYIIPEYLFTFWHGFGFRRS